MTAPQNPLLAPGTAPFGMPPFAAIRPEHFKGAFDIALAAQKDAVKAIVGSSQPADFENTVAAFEQSGLPLERVTTVFFNLIGTDSSDALQAIEREVAPRLSRHRSEIFLDPGLFARLSELWEKRANLGLTPEQSRVLERYHTLFTRAGAMLDQAGKDRLAAIMERLAVLGTEFSQNLLADEKAYALILEQESELAGLPDWLRAAAAQAAADRGFPGKHAVTLSRSIIEPFLQFSTRRDLREEAFRAWISRGEHDGKTDNRAVMAEMVRLRAERAALLGFDSFAHFRIDDAMAKTPDRVAALLASVWQPGKRRAEGEAAAMQQLIAADGDNFELAPWDWRHYAERVRKARYDFDEGQLKPYLQLDRMIEAAFHVANRLFGLSFTERTDIPLHHPDARVWEVKERDRHVGLFIGDYYARSSKKSGAWMSSFRSQHRMDGEVRPIIINVMNFAKPPAGRPALLSFDDAHTLFHEFGHALHGLLSDVTYPLISGTSVARDFVELPSQLYEHWLEQPEVLSRFALHAETGEPMPKALLDKVLAARTFNQGFATVEYTSSAEVDLDLHLLPSGGDVDVVGFEKEVLARIGMPKTIVMRHRTPHFGHVFSGEGYAAGYYSYLWSEVLDADGFGAFEETGDIFHGPTAKRLRRYIYSAGSLQPPDEAYRAFRGRDPRPEALLRKRGLDQFA